MQSLYGVRPTQDICARYAAFTIPTREHVVGRTRSGLFLRLKDLGHELKIDVLFEAYVHYVSSKSWLLHAIYCGAPQVRASEKFR